MRQKKGKGELIVAKRVPWDEKVMLLVLRSSWCAGRDGQKEEHGYKYKRKMRGNVEGKPES